MIEPWDCVRHFPIDKSWKWVVRDEQTSVCSADYDRLFWDFRVEANRPVMKYGFWIATLDFEDAVLWMLKYVQTNH